jgi:hypothetical protein
VNQYNEFIFKKTVHTIIVHNHSYVGTGINLRHFIEKGGGHYIIATRYKFVKYSPVYVKDPLSRTM